MSGHSQQSRGLGSLSNLPRRSFISMAGFAAGAFMVSPRRWLFAELPDSANGTTTAKPFQFTNEPQRRRKSFYDLSDDELVLLCKAVSHMKNGSKDVPLSMTSPVVPRKCV